MLVVLGEGSQEHKLQTTFAFQELSQLWFSGKKTFSRALQNFSSSLHPTGPCFAFEEWLHCVFHAVFWWISAVSSNCHPVYCLDMPTMFAERRDYSNSKGVSRNFPGFLARFLSCFWKLDFSHAWLTSLQPGVNFSFWFRLWNFTFTCIKSFCVFSLLPFPYLKFVGKIQNIFW